MLTFKFGAGERAGVEKGEIEMLERGLEVLIAFVDDAESPVDLVGAGEARLHVQQVQKVLDRPAGGERGSKTRREGAMRQRGGE